MSVKSNPLDKEKLNMIIVPDCVSQVNNPSYSRKMLHEEIEIKYFYEGTSTLRPAANIAKLDAKGTKPAVDIPVAIQIIFASAMPQSK